MKIHSIILLLSSYILILNIPVYLCARPPNWGCLSLVSPKMQQNYTIGSTFQSNLQQLLAGLPQKATQNNYFYNATYGEAPDQVYGLIMCYADTSTAACDSCMSEASLGIMECCALNKNGVAWYNECMIRYSDVAVNATNNIGLMGCGPKVLDSKPESLAEPKKFRDILRQLFDGLATNASRSPLRLGAGKMNYTPSANIYALAQCTRQLPSDECRMCIGNLTDLGVEYCTGDKAVQADETLMTISCYARFALKPFYVISDAHPPWPNSSITLSLSFFL
ncbi:Cysteine-rich receptor-like protein kinase 25 [Carex littledalei]|uniref:Cysteine-rich receptor-like protein kinase 25 n=1 Tax=Carex littledalei TaxID=544730 RepID=A0A833VIS8_9POAL|nr:Cysteine-rich receptor-like protein kinase 25 [Carex littledalei]